MSRKISGRALARQQATIERRTSDAMAKAEATARNYTGDSYQNFAARVGIGTDNMSSASRYGFNPVSRIRTLMEWTYRGSWLCRVAVDVIANDMTRAGIEVSGELSPEERQKLDRALLKFQIWGKLNSTIKWARLYGGCIAVMLIDGQDPSFPLRLETIKPDQFKGLLVLDRWMVEPSLEDLVSEMGADMGLPKYYRVTTDAPGMRGAKIHYSRCIRIIGDDLPWWQLIAENLWGASVLEALWDRLTAFDSATLGTAQLVYKAHLRTHKVENLRELIAAGGKMFEALVKQVEHIRRFQSNEGLTLIDSKDEMEYNSYSFAGLSDVLLQLGQQISGALQIPLTRLFGQSPAGLNSTGESDLRTYYDNINQQQELRLRPGTDTLMKVIAASEGFMLPDDFGFMFRSLWQMNEVEKADVANKVTDTVTKALDAGLISPRRALNELRDQSRQTGVFNTVEDEDVEQLDEMIQPPVEIDPETGQPVPVEPGGEPGGGEEGGNPFGGGEEAAEAEGGDTEQGSPHEGTAGKPGGPEGAPGEKAPQNKGQPAAAKKIDRSTDRRMRDHSLPPLTEVHGLPIVIETRRGEVRKGGAGARRWAVTMPADYGYIRGTSSAEGAMEQLDVFVCGDNPDAVPEIFIVDTLSPATGYAFDEHKVVLGMDSEDAVRNLFRAAYHDNADARIGAITRVTLRTLKKWMRTGDMLKPYAWRALK